MAKRAAPDQQALLGIMEIARQYDPDAMAETFVLLAAGLIATSRNPDRMLAKLQRYLAERVKHTTDNLPHTLEVLDAAKAELESLDEANKGLRRKQ
jgi:hypothetical protein